MAKRKKQRKPKNKLAREIKTAKRIEEDKKLRPIIFIAIFVLVLGGVIAYNTVFEPSPNSGDSTVVDRYGRSPGHSHYGHGHP